MTILPTSVLPVKTTFLTGGENSFSPIVEPVAMRVFKTPGGRPPPMLRISSIFLPIMAVSEAGLKTTVLPASKAIKIPDIGMENG